MKASVLALVSMLMALPAMAQTVSSEGADVKVRRLAGLPPESANGQIRILDAGHFPLDTFISIVANRSQQGWKVSYACAMSPRCGAGKDSFAREYVLSREATTDVDRIVSDLRSGQPPRGIEPSPGLIGGNLHVLIDYGGFKQEYRRTVTWGPLLSDLEKLLAAPARGETK